MGKNVKKQEICAIIEKEYDNVSTNIVNILSKAEYLGTQEELGSQLGISQSAISKMKNKTSHPSLHLLLFLLKKYHLPLEVLKDHILSPEELSSYFQVSAPRQGNRELDKYVGSYFIYYFNNGNDIGRSENGENLLDYGLVYVYGNESDTEFDLDVRAVIGVQNPDTLILIKKELDKMTPDMQQSEFESIALPGHSYKGKLNISPSRKDFLAMSLEGSTDSVQILLLRPTLKDERVYVGGLGTINSISRKEYQPCIQLVALSRNLLSPISAEEIAHHLYMKQPNVSPMMVQHIFYFINCLYKTMEFDEEQLSAIITPYLKWQIEHEIRNKQMRFHQISGDRAWYEMIKPYHGEYRNDKRK